MLRTLLFRGQFLHKRVFACANNFATNTDLVQAERGKKPYRKKVKNVGGESPLKKLVPKRGINFNKFLAKTSSWEQDDKGAEKFFQLWDEKEGKVESIDWKSSMEAIMQAEFYYPVKRFDSQELESMKADCITFNLAKLINNSFTLRKLVDIGVDLSSWEKDGFLNLALRIDYDRDIKPKLQFLLNDLNLKVEDVSYIFSECPYIFDEDVENLKTRVNYLTTKKFNNKMIRQIVSEDPTWLTFSFQEIDSRLGYLQKFFNLSGNQVRSLTVQMPQLVTWAGIPGQIRLNHLILVDACGFCMEECQSMLMACPEIYYHKNESDLESIVKFLHNDVGYPHELLKKFPKTFLTEAIPNRPRLEFLKKLKKNVFDPKKPNYVSPDKLVLTTDLEFCQSVAKQPVSVFNDFLKTI